MTQKVSDRSNRSLKLKTNYLLAPHAYCPASEFSENRLEIARRAKVDRKVGLSNKCNEE